MQPLKSLEPRSPGRRASGAGPDLSVVVPCLNEAESLRELVRRLGQTFPVGGPIAAEFLVVDDGSADATPRLFRELQAREPRLIPVIRPQRGGPDRCALVRIDPGAWPLHRPARR